MSDCFDHEADAYDQMLDGRGDEPDGPDYPDGLWYGRRPRRPKAYNRFTKTCNRCGKTGLYWEKTEPGWRLFTPDGFKLHVCGESESPKPRPPERSPGVAALLVKIALLTDSDKRQMHTALDQMIWPDEDDWATFGDN